VLLSAFERPSLSLSLSLSLSPFSSTAHPPPFSQCLLYGAVWPPILCGLLSYRLQLQRHADAYGMRLWPRLSLTVSHARLREEGEEGNTQMAVAYRERDACYWLLAEGQGKEAR
jgi:hypothetical protein